MKSLAIFAANLSPFVIFSSMRSTAKEKSATTNFAELSSKESFLRIPLSYLLQVLT